METRAQLPTNKPTTMVLQYNKIIATFAECPLPPLDDTPNNAYLTELNSYLNSCMASVHSNFGNGNVGYLVLTAQPASFAMACSDLFVQPRNTGATFSL